MGFYKQAMHGRPSDEPFLLWGPPFMTGDQFLLEMLQMGSRMVENTLVDILIAVGPFGPHWNVDKPAMFGHFWSKGLFLKVSTVGLI